VFTIAALCCRLVLPPRHRKEQKAMQELLRNLHDLLGNYSELANGVPKAQELFIARLSSTALTDADYDLAFRMGSEAAEFADARAAALQLLLRYERAHPNRSMTGSWVLQQHGIYLEWVGLEVGYLKGYAKFLANSVLAERKKESAVAPQ